MPIFRAALAGLAMFATHAAAQQSASEPPPATFAYQGVLLFEGAPADTTVDVRVTLHRLESIDSPLRTGEVSGVAVQDGLLSFSFPFDTIGLDAWTLWAEIEVREQGQPSYNTLSPRQPYHAASRAVQAQGAQIRGDDSVVLFWDEDVFPALVYGTPDLTVSVETVWQSFGAPLDGYLSGVGLVATPGTADSVRMNVYVGEGVGGELLMSGVPMVEDGGVYVYEHGSPILEDLVGGQIYTAEFEFYNSGTGQPGEMEVYLAPDHVSPARSSVDPTRDLYAAILVGKKIPWTYVRGNDGRVYVGGQILNITDPGGGNDALLLDTVADQQRRIEQLEEAVRRLTDEDAPVR